MKINSKSAIVFLVIGLILGGVSFGIARSFNQSATAGKEKAIYYCPMHPTYTSDRPGDCPICNMKLVKKEMEDHEAHTAEEHRALIANEAKQPPRELTVEELMKMKPGEICLLHKCKMGTCMIAMTEEMARLGKCPHCGEDLGIVVKDAVPQGYAAVKLNQEKQQVLGLRTALVEKKAMNKTIRALGRIAYDPELYQAEEEFVQALKAAQKAEKGTVPEIKEQANKLADSGRLKLKLMGLNDDLIAEIEKSGVPDRTLLYGEPGKTVWLYAPIYEYELPLVKVGQKVAVEVPAVQGKAYEGIIRSIDPVLDPTTRTVRVRAQLENTDGSLRPEMYVNALVEVALGEVLAVPEEAVFMTGEKNIVFVDKGNGKFEPREIFVGAKADEYYEVKKGLGAGESVVTSGNFLIDSESRLKSALEGMTSGGGHQHAA